MTHNKDWHSGFTNVNGGKMMMGNSQTCQVEGIGSMSIKMFDGVVRHLTNVRYVLRLTKNLISLGILDDARYMNNIEAGSMKVCKGSMVVIKGVKKNGLYHLIGETITSKNGVAKTEDHKAMIWHRRLGHISEKGLNEISKQGLLGKDKVSEMDFCEHYMLGKHHRLSFKVGQHNSKAILEYLHLDL